VLLNTKPPIIIIRRIAVALDVHVGAIERRVAPWPAKNAGRDQQ
jgi:hypothetical protein